MNRIEKKFLEAKQSQRKILSLFLTAGYPSLDVTEKLACSFGEMGVDLLEIGFPFSDPIADGKTIQHSSEIALKNGITWEKTIKLVKKIRSQTDVPLIFMSYSNPLFVRGWESSACQIAKAGFDGVILPDIIPEEAALIRSVFSQQGIHLIHLLSVTSSLERMKLIAKFSSGFVYCVSVTGVTGARKNLPLHEIRQFLLQAKKTISLPLLLGFGISSPAQILQLKDTADGFILGSALLHILYHNLSEAQLVQRAKKFIQPFLKATNHRV